MLMYMLAPCQPPNDARKCQRGTNMTEVVKYFGVLTPHVNRSLYRLSQLNPEFVEAAVPTKAGNPE